MPRFRKGTMDHDGDGRKGGSMPKTKAAPKAAPKRIPRKAKSVEPKSAVAQPAEEAPPAEPTSEEVDPARAAIEARQREVQAMFAVADAAADPAVEEASLSRQVRGF